MEIRNNAEALKRFLGVSDLSANVQKRAADSGGAKVDLLGDQVSVSDLGARVLDSAGGETVRLDKVSAVQQAIAAGTYSVPAAKVADKIMDMMLTGSVSTEG